jgi:hypothetical protein
VVKSFGGLELSGKGRIETTPSHNISKSGGAKLCKAIPPFPAFVLFGREFSCKVNGANVSQKLDQIVTFEICWK